MAVVLLLFVDKSFVFQHVLRFLTFSYEDAMFIYKKLLEDDPANSVSFRILYMLITVYC